MRSASRVGPLCCQAAPRGVKASTKAEGRRESGRRESGRRELLLGTSLLAWSLGTRQAMAVQGTTAGRIPVGKSGGHGVGWTEIIPYSFRVPEGWEEVPVSIADLGGTEVMEGSLEVVVAPVLRFLDVGYNAEIRIDEIGSPQKVIEGFAPELFGAPLEEGDVLETEVITKDGIPYYTWHFHDISSCHCICGV